MEKNKKLTLLNLAKENIRRKVFRSFSLIILITLFSFTLITGSILSMSLSKGVSSLSDRLGADVMVVPAGYDVHIDSILLSGKPSNFYLPADAVDKIKTIEGIDKMTTQTYLATLSASCCSYPVQLIGIDYDTDFLIKPWMEETVNMDLAYGEIIIGNKVAGEPGQEIKFFGKPFTIKGRLQQTGMGFDATVFMTKETIADLAVEAVRKMKHPLSDDGSLISTIMIKLKEGYESEVVAKEITTKFGQENIFGLFSKKFVNKISANLIIISSYIKVIIGVLWILAVIVIALLFAMTLSERKKEMATLRVLGATKGQLVKLVLIESSLISLYGSILGMGLSYLGVVLLGKNISESLKIPFLLPPTSTVIITVIICFMASFLTGPLSSLYSALKLSKADVYQSMREGN